MKDHWLREKWRRLEALLTGGARPPPKPALTPHELHELLEFCRDEAENRQVGCHEDSDYVQAAVRAVSFVEQLIEAGQ